MDLTAVPKFDEVTVSHLAKQPKLWQILPLAWDISHEQLISQCCLNEERINAVNAPEGEATEIDPVNLLQENMSQEGPAVTGDT
ncbi:hypothetical protein F53441_14436, partial [Fusarium austroafricanum]